MVLIIWGEGVMPIEIFAIEQDLAACEPGTPESVSLLLATGEARSPVGGDHDSILPFFPQRRRKGRREGGRKGGRECVLMSRKNTLSRASLSKEETNDIWLPQQGQVRWKLSWFP